MKDVQNSPATVALAIDRVGVKNITLPIWIRSKEKDAVSHHTVAKVALYVDLPAKFKGTHMSRFIDALGRWSKTLDYASFKDLLEYVCHSLQARRAHITFTFSYFLTKKAPATASPGIMDYAVHLSGQLADDTLTWELGVDVPVMTVCPCSLAISSKGAHSQRAIVRIRTKHTGLLWIEDLITIAEAAGSSPVYSLLKRADEKAVTDKAFDSPAFVEDVVRAAAKALKQHPQVYWFKVEVESEESIHNHNAYACIEGEKSVP